MQVPLGNEKSFGKWVKTLTVLLTWTISSKQKCLQKITLFFLIIDIDKKTWL